MNLALSDEQEFLREAARGALVALQDARGRPRARSTATSARCPTCGRLAMRGRLARPADRRGPRRRRARRVRRDARAQECGRVLAGVAAARAPAGRPRCSTLARRRAVSRQSPAARRARRSLPARPPGDLDARLDASTRAAAWSAARARGDASTATATRHRRGRVGARRARRRPARRRRARRDGSAGRRRGRGRPRASRSSRARYDATRSLGHVTLDGAPATRAGRRRRGDLARGVVPRAGADRRRVARQRSRRRSRWPSPTRRSASPFGRAIGSYQASSTGWSRSCASSRTAARCSTTRAGPARPRPRSSRSPRARRARPPAARSTSPRAEHRRARRHRRDVGARRAAVLPPRAARLLLGGTAA